MITGVFTIAAAFGINTQVEVPASKYTENIYQYSQTPTKVNNIGLLNHRQNVLILGGIICIVGAILFVGDSKKKIIPQDVTCPHCNQLLELTEEEINEGKYVCDNCSSTVPII